jgi:23S rRNA (cytidine2498-2'-O)-methyltransferase
MQKSPDIPVIYTCAAGYERFLERELGDRECTVVKTQSTVPGIVQTTASPDNLQAAGFPCFARLQLKDPLVHPFTKSNEAASFAADFFCRTIRTERIDTSWPLYIGYAGDDTPPVHIAPMAEAIIERLRKAVARVAKLAQPEEWLDAGDHRGLFIVLGNDTMFLSRECRSGGQRRMAMAPGAPSRSYLKLEEAFRILGHRPAPADLVVDLGAAPGGWSFSAASCGARVIAVDNGPLRDGAASNPLIEHRREDAFTFAPPGTKAQWLLCDMVEEPHRIMALVRTWLQRSWCDYLIVNFKFGRSDPLKVLDAAGSTRHGCAPFLETMLFRHLYHDREELTLLGRRRSG